MKYARPLIVVAAAFALAQPVAFARPGGGGGMSGANPSSPPAHGGAMANSNGTLSMDRDFGRARAEDRMSANAGASVDSNGPRSSDRDFGRDRAQDRMSAQGKLHAKAKTKTGKKKVNPA